MKQIADRLFRLLIGAVTAQLAGAVFQRVWRLVAKEEQAPVPTDPRRSLGEVATGGLVQGAIFGLIQALLNRGGAAGIERVTGERPGQPDRDR